MNSPAAPTIFVSKLGGIYGLTQNITKVTFVLVTGGRADAVETASRLWEMGALDEADRAPRWAFGEIRRGSFGFDERLGPIRAN